MASRRQAGAAAAGTDDAGLDPLAGGAGGEAGGGEGGAGSSTSRHADPPSPVTVLIGGKTYQVPAEVAESIAAEQESFHRERARFAGEIKQLTRRQPDTTAVREPEEPRRPPARLAVEDIDEWDRQMAAYEAHRDLRLEQRLEGHFSERDKATRDRTELDVFMGRLGRKYTALDGEDNLLLAAMNRVAKKYPGDPLPFSDPRTLELVAQEASSELARLAEKGKSLAPKVPKIEGQGGRGGTAAGNRSEERREERGPTSIADIQRERRLRRLRHSRAGLGREEE